MCEGVPPPRHHQSREITACWAPVCRPLTFSSICVLWYQGSVLLQVVGDITTTRISTPCNVAPVLATGRIRLPIILPDVSVLTILPTALLVEYKTPCKSAKWQNIGGSVYNPLSQSASTCLSLHAKSCSPFYIAFLILKMTTKQNFPKAVGFYSCLLLPSAFAICPQQLPSWFGMNMPGKYIFIRYMVSFTTQEYGDRR